MYKCVIVFVRTSLILFSLVNQERVILAAVCNQIGIDLDFWQYKHGVWLAGSHAD